MEPPQYERSPRRGLLLNGGRLWGLRCRRHCAKHQAAKTILTMLQPVETWTDTGCIRAPGNDDASRLRNGDGVFRSELCTPQESCLQPIHLFAGLYPHERVEIEG